MKKFLWLFTLFFIFSLHSVVEAQNYEAQRDEENLKFQSEEMGREFKERIKNMPPEQKKAEYEKLKSISTTTQLKEMFPQFYGKHVGPHMKTPYNTTYCLNKCFNCGGQISDAGQMLSTTGQCFATCLNSPDGRAKNYARACLANLVKFEKPTPEPAPPPVVTPEPPAPPSITPPPAPEPLPPSPPSVTKCFYCEPPRTAVNHEIIHDYLKGKFVFVRSPYTRIITASPGQKSPVAQPSQKPQKAPEPTQVKSKKESLDLGAIVKAGSKLLQGDVQGAAKSLEQDQRRVDATNRFLQERDRRFNEKHRQPHSIGVHPPYGWNSFSPGYHNRGLQMDPRTGRPLPPVGTPYSTGNQPFLGMERSWGRYDNPYGMSMRSGAYGPYEMRTEPYDPYNPYGDMGNRSYDPYGPYSGAQGIQIDPLTGRSLAPPFNSAKGQPYPPRSLYYSPNQSFIGVNSPHGLGSGFHNSYSSYGGEDQSYSPYGSQSTQIDPATGQPLAPPLDPMAGQPYSSGSSYYTESFSSSNPRGYGTDPYSVYSQSSLPQNYGAQNVQIDPATGQPLAPPLDPRAGQSYPSESSYYSYPHSQPFPSSTAPGYGLDPSLSPQGMTSPYEPYSPISVPNNTFMEGSYPSSYPTFTHTHSHPPYSSPYSGHSPHQYPLGPQRPTSLDVNIGRAERIAPLVRSLFR